MSDTITISPERPYVGLRPFNSSEGELFFGREQHVKRLLIKLHQSNFVAVVGNSGSGKSSLVRAGVIPALRAGFLNQGDQWFIATFRPGNNPIHYLSKALIETFELSISPVELEKKIQLEGVTEVISHVGPFIRKDESSLLILIDQFEEIFTHFKSITEQSALIYRFEFIKIILDLIDKDLPIYIILTLRSDFIAKCNTFHGLAEMVSGSQFLVPKLHTSDLRRAIEGPITFFGGSLQDGLAQKILNDLEDGEDQLPVLQHALNQLWRVRKSDNTITIDDYESIGRLEKALSLHANSIYNEIIVRQPHLELTIKEMFKFIIELDGQKQEGVRRPRKVHEIQRITGATFEEIKIIYDAFSADHACFMYSPSQKDLDEFSVIDISHESLIREWDMFKKWREEEERDKRYVQRLRDFASEFKEKKRGALHGPELGIYTSWSKYLHYNSKILKEQVLYWATRYQVDFETVHRYIRLSQRKTWFTNALWCCLALIILVGAVELLTMERQREIAKDQNDIALKKQQIAERKALQAQTDSATFVAAQRLKESRLDSLTQALEASVFEVTGFKDENARLKETIRINEGRIAKYAAKEGAQASLLATDNENLNRSLIIARERYSKAQATIDSLKNKITSYERRIKLDPTIQNSVNAFNSTARVKGFRPVINLGQGSYDICVVIEAPAEEVSKIDKVQYYVPNMKPIEVSTSATKFKHCCKTKSTFMQVVVVYTDGSSKRLDYEWGPYEDN